MLGAPTRWAGPSLAAQLGIKVRARGVDCVGTAVGDTGAIGDRRSVREKDVALAMRSMLAERMQALGSRC